MKNRIKTIFKKGTACALAVATVLSAGIGGSLVEASMRSTTTSITIQYEHLGLPEGHNITEQPAEELAEPGVPTTPNYSTGDIVEVNEKTFYFEGWSLLEQPIEQPEDHFDFTQAVTSDELIFGHWKEITPGLEVAKIVKPEAYRGEVVTYEVVITNAGKAEYSNTVVADTLIDFDTVENLVVSNGTEGILYEIIGRDLVITEVVNPGDVITINYDYTIPSDAEVTSVIANTIEVSATYLDKHEPLMEDSEARVTVLPDAIMTVQKTSNKESLPAGSDVTYTIKVTNESATDIDEVVISDPVLASADITAVVEDAEGEYITHKRGRNVQLCNGCGADITGFAEEHIREQVMAGVFACGGWHSSVIHDTITLHEPIEASGYATVTYKYTQKDLGVFTNTASVAATNPLVKGSELAGTDSVDVEFVKPASFTVKKTAEKDAYMLGDEASYTVTITNDGGFDLADVLVTDKAFPNAADMVVLVNGEEIDVTVEGNAFTIPSILMGEAAVITYKYAHDKAGEFVSATQAEVLDPNNDSLTLIEMGDVTTIFHDDIAITVDKEASVKEAMSGSPVGYTVTVENHSDVEISSVFVDDTIPFKLDGVSLNSTERGIVPFSTDTEGNLTLDSLLAREVVTINYDHEQSEAGEFVNAVKVEAPHPTVDGIMLSDEASTRVAFVDPVIAVSKIAKQETVLVGENATFEIEILDENLFNAHSMTVSDQAFIKATNIVVNGANYSLDGENMSLTDIEKRVTITYDYTQDTAGSYENTVDVAAKFGTVSAKANGKATINFVDEPIIEIKKSSNKTEATVNEIVEYQTIVENPNDVALEGVEVLDDLFKTATNLKVLVDGEEVAFTLNGSTVVIEQEIKAGAKALISFDATSKTPQAVTTAATVTAKNPYIPSKELTDSAETTVVFHSLEASRVDMTMTSDVAEMKVGGVVKYTIAIENKSPRALNSVMVSGATFAIAKNLKLTSSTGEIVEFELNESLVLTKGLLGGEVVTITYEYTQLETGIYESVAAVVAKDPINSDVDLLAEATAVVSFYDEATLPEMGDNEHQVGEIPTEPTDPEEPNEGDPTLPELGDNEHQVGDIPEVEAPTGPEGEVPDEETGEETDEVPTAPEGEIPDGDAGENSTEDSTEEDVKDESVEEAGMIEALQTSDSSPIYLYIAIMTLLLFVAGFILKIKRV